MQKVELKFSGKKCASVNFIGEIPGSWGEMLQSDRCRRRTFGYIYPPGSHCRPRDLPIRRKQEKTGEISRKKLKVIKHHLRGPEAPPFLISLQFRDGTMGPITLQVTEAASETQNPLAVTVPFLLRTSLFAPATTLF